ncbi:hypothetical protein PSN45_000944 [Yamadazyma tenuis]
MASHLFRVDSGDTLLNERSNPDSTFEAHEDDTESLATFNSLETLTNTLFDSPIPISNYSLKILPIVSSFLSNDVQVFRSEADAQNHADDAKSAFPLLSTSSSILNYFKLNSPLLVINSHTSATDKHEFCRVYFRFLHKNLTCYVLIFNFNGCKKVCLLLNNELRPYVDCVWHTTKLRILGPSGATSTFGNGFIKAFVVDKPYNTLTDQVQVSWTSEPSSAKDIKIDIDHQNPLISSLLAHNKQAVGQNLTGTRPVLRTPVAMFMDGNKRLKKGAAASHLRIFDPSDKNHGITDNGMVLAAILLTLRESEVRKNKGTNKPTFTR